MLVRNNTRVIPARLVGRREATGGRWEGLFLRTLPDGDLGGPGDHPGQAGRRRVRGRGPGPAAPCSSPGARPAAGPSGPRSRDPSRARTRRRRRPRQLLERHGQVPLPPYIRKGREGPGDRLRYQTLYAQVPGAVAAPTAGLHFTDEVFRRLAARGIASVDCTLHVGLGTFRPIEAERIEDHRLHAEWAELTPPAAATLNQAARQGGRIVAVGTTSARVLETRRPRRGGTLQAFAGETALYLRPGHVFRGLDALLTNFHLPRSSLLVLVAALAGVDLIRAAYAEAIRERYRFYSYGDAMLIL